VTATVASFRLAARPGTSRWASGAFLAICASLTFPTPALAQFGGTVGVDSDYRLRGYSLTGGDPALSVQATYDHPSGAYANLAGIADLGGSEVRFMGVLANVGYARRLSSHVTIDGGLLRSQIRASSRYRQSYHYTEIYAGAAVGRVVGRIYYSPDYRSHGVSTLYGELETGFEPARDWRVSGHVGSLLYLTDAPYREAGSTHQDWRISVARRLGRMEIHSAFSGGGPGVRYYGYYRTEKAAFTVGASVSF
jgi:uncharacterized protein (TIGR02001 family)